jgi:hypothetical protein
MARVLAVSFGILNWKLRTCLISRRVYRNQVTGWAGMVRVDGETYTWMGLPGTTTVNQTGFEYTSTKTIFTMNVLDKVEMNITFMSPITPTDLMRQSLVFLVPEC